MVPLTLNLTKSRQHWENPVHVEMQLDIATGSRWAYSACTNTPTLMYVDFESMKSFPNKSDTLSPALYKKMRSQTFVPKKKPAGICPGFKKHSPLVLSSPPSNKTSPTHCYSGLLQNLFVPLQASPSASKNLDSITNVFLMHWWKHSLKIISFSLRKFSIK